MCFKIISTTYKTTFDPSLTHDGRAIPQISFCLFLVLFLGFPLFMPFDFPRAASRARV